MSYNKNFKDNSRNLLYIKSDISNSKKQMPGKNATCWQKKSTTNINSNKTYKIK